MYPFVQHNGRLSQGSVDGDNECYLNTTIDGFVRNNLLQKK